MTRTSQHFFGSGINGNNDPGEGPDRPLESQHFFGSGINGNVMRPDGYSMPLLRHNTSSEVELMET